MTELKTTRVTDMEVNSYEDSDGIVLVDKIKFVCPDVENEQITFKPRTQETTVHEKDGFETRETNTVRYTLAGFLEENPEYKDVQEALKMGEIVELEAVVSYYDQSEDDSVEGDDTYVYIDSSDVDSIKLKKKEAE